MSTFFRNNLEAISGFEEEAEDLRNLDWASSMWGDVLENLDDDTPVDNSPQFMNQQDYTLNSPLIADSLNSFIHYLLENKKDLLHYNRTWDKRKMWLTKKQIPDLVRHSTKLFHANCKELWMQREREVTWIRRIILEADDDAKKTHSILYTYVEQWIGQEIKFASRSVNTMDTLWYGELMLEFMLISWIINATTEYELNNLVEEFGLIVENPEDIRDGIIYVSPNLGRVHIGFGLVFFQKLKTLWDRNMILMFKDTSTARFQTLMAISHRSKDPYVFGHLSTMEELYRAGDRMIAHDISSGFEGIGLIEPLASLKLADLARSYRPLIPEFPHFKEHVSEKSSALIKINIYAKRFLDIIDEVEDKRILLTIYGSFRNWGHPFIDYIEGLKQLHKNVTSKVIIDEEYAELLASDLAFKILKKMFYSKFKWFVNKDLMDSRDILYEHIVNNTWPSIGVLVSYPPKWHKLPLLKCWDIPEVVDPSLIYSDKTHSVNFDVLINHLKRTPYAPIPTLKVLDTLLHSPATNWKEFLQTVNDVGLSKNDLIIGLKAKEREIKSKGRFFALMSWNLRQYFVMTEYLIKMNVLPLFKGLTMADNQTTLIKKMLKNTSGQGGDDYERVTIANHFDYSKWNNFQRKKATSPIFTVIGKFHGLPELFARTHQFFEESFIYYRDRPDLMRVENDKIVNKESSIIVCWQGQEGGLEGLRQKGWSVVNLLCIDRAGKVRNTQIQILAQGDNQVICLFYKVNPYLSEGDLKIHLSDIKNNNDIVIEAIREAVTRIGLTINEDETLQSADLLLYGKVIVFRGNITCLEEKRYSRINCTTNDQLPSMGNVLSTVSTNCLTVAHYSKSSLNAMIQYNWMGNFCINILNMHNPALRCNPRKLLKDPSILKNYLYRIALLYLDPSLGGFSGMSLSRFHMRMFPDPVCESLTFWRSIGINTTDNNLKQLAASVGNPKLLHYQLRHFSKLIEDPTSLNLPRGLSSVNLIKDEIKSSMIQNPYTIQNEVIRDAVIYIRQSETNFMCFLSTINPCFPRFISEFHSASFFGLTNQIVGLFQNSKTIRNMFKKKFQKKVDQAIIKCELGSLEALSNTIKPRSQVLWACSAQHADVLRERSWGRKIVGTTVPHPAELINQISKSGPSCLDCSKPIPFSLKIIVLVPEGITDPDNHRGPYIPYLGSSTAENTSLIQPWEKDTDISFIRKAANARKALNWFVLPSSNLGKSIKGNLDSLIGESSGETIMGFKRTGSALHRYGCSRVSPGGYSANNSVYGSRLIISTDNFQLLGDTNFDFMYQSIILYAQQTAGEFHQESPLSATYHFHIQCKSCLREIEEPILESDLLFDFPDVSHQLSKWKPADTPWMKDSITVNIAEGHWDALDNLQKCEEIGRVQGIMFGNLSNSYADAEVVNHLFPISLRSKLNPIPYFLGLIDGLYKAALLDATRRRILYKSNTVEPIIRACYLRIISDLSANPDFLVFIQCPALFNEINKTHHRIPPSYPMSLSDLGISAKIFFKNQGYLSWLRYLGTSRHPVWIFADFLSVPLSGIIIIADTLARELNTGSLPNLRRKAKEFGDVLTALRNREKQTDIQRIINTSNRIYLCKQEVRHAVKYGIIYKPVPFKDESDLVFGPGPNLNWRSVKVEYGNIYEPRPQYLVPKIQNPLVSGLRIPQIATGSFLKIRTIYEKLRLQPSGALIGGDGSGGITSLTLRMYPHCRAIFNSLLDFKDVDLSGTLPSPPSAIISMPTHVQERCINLNSVWELPQDLAQISTWEGFNFLKKKNRLHLNLAVFDMECRSAAMSDAIEDRFEDYIPNIMEVNSTVIIKTYLSRLTSAGNLLERLGKYFHYVFLIQTEVSSSHTSEIYVVFQRLRTAEIIELYPIWSLIKTWLDRTYCLRDYKAEFERAQTLLAIDLTHGIPPRFLPDPLLELLGIWETIMSDRVVLVRWFDVIRENSTKMVDYAMLTLGILSQQMLPTTRWIMSGEVIVPSDNDLSKFFGYYVGTLLYVALVTGDSELGEEVQSMINKPFYIFVGLVDSQSNEGGTRHQTVFWKIKPIEGWIKTKKVFVQHRLALIGSTLRQLLSINKSNQKLSRLQNLDQCKLVNRSLTPNLLICNTGIFDLL